MIEKVTRSKKWRDKQIALLNEETKKKNIEKEMEEEKFLFKPFDVVKFTDKNGTHYGMVISGGETASVDWFEKPCPHNAWWRKDDGLVVVNNAMKIIANNIESASTIGYTDYTPQGDRLFELLNSTKPQEND